MSRVSLLRGRSSRRGSTLVYVVMVSTVVSLLVGANLDFTSAIRKRQVRAEEAARWTFARLGLEQTALVRARNTPSEALDPLSVDSAGQTYSATVSDPGTGFLELQMSSGPGASRRSLIVKPDAPNPVLYGLYVKDSADIKDSLTLGSASEPTHAFFGKSPSLDSTLDLHEIFGAVDCGATTLPAFDRTGLKSFGVGTSDTKVPTYDEMDDGADLAQTGSRNVTTRSFPAGQAGKAYLYAVKDDLTLTGTITGNVTIYAGGKVTINAPLRAAAGSRLVIISKGDVDVSGAGDVTATLWCGKKVTLKAPPIAFSTKWRGAIVCDQFVAERTLTLTLDPYFYAGSEARDDYFLPVP